MGGVHPSPPDLGDQTDIPTLFPASSALLQTPPNISPTNDGTFPSPECLNEGTLVGGAAVVSDGPLVSFPNSYLRVDTLRGRREISLPE